MSTKAYISHRSPEHCRDLCRALAGFPTTALSEPPSRLHEFRAAPCASHSADAGYHLVERTANVLDKAATVTVVTNSRLVPADYFQRVTPGDNDVFVIFNRHRFRIDAALEERTIWIHRFDESSGTYFGAEEPAETPADRIHRVYVAAPGPGDAVYPAAASCVSYRASLPGLHEYPVGRKTFSPLGRVRRIASPSTGFVTFAWLQHIRRDTGRFHLRAVGVGREYNGWPGHDWGFERRHLSRSDIEFVTPDGRHDRWHGAIDRLPYGMLRTVFKLGGSRRRAA